MNSIWVVSEGTKIKRESSVSSKTLATLDPGTELDHVSDSDRWIEVRLPSGETGWVFGANVADTPPPTGNEVEDLDDLLDDPPGNDIRPDAADTSRSIR